MEKVPLGKNEGQKKGRQEEVAPTMRQHYPSKIEGHKTEKKENMITGSDSSNLVYKVMKSCHNKTPKIHIKPFSSEVTLIINKHAIQVTFERPETLHTHYTDRQRK